MREFHSQLTSKAVDLFPSLTEDDLKPYLLRSRATNAYDGVTLLARSAGLAFDQGGGSCTSMRHLQKVALEEIFMVYIQLLNDTVGTNSAHLVIIISSVLTGV